jgi:hypothetical protein
MELVYLLCQLAAAEVCEQHRLPLFQASALTCTLNAQAELARVARPGWRVARWSCAASASEAERAGLTE